MEALDFKRYCEAKREFDFSHSGIVLRLRAWDKVQFMRLAGELPAGDNRAIAYPAVLVPPAVIGWRDVKKKHLAPDADDEPLPFSSVHVNDVLSAFPNLLEAAYEELDRRYGEMMARAQANVKN